MLFFPSWLVFKHRYNRRVLTPKIFLNASQEQVLEGLDLINADCMTANSAFDRMAIEFLYIKNIVGQRSTYFWDIEDRLFELRCFLRKISSHSEDRFRLQCSEDGFLYY